MTKKAELVIRHDLETMSKEEVFQYLRDVSQFIGLDPDLNALDVIWMPNESGQGRSLVVYARRGTAEILRNMLGIEVDSLTNEEIKGSIVFTAKGHDAKGRHEIAIGSKYIANINGKQLDDAIMTASTRALRRLTMQFTTLGILDESEVVGVVGQDVNPAAGATLSNNPMPPIFVTPTVAANNGPGKAVETPSSASNPLAAGIPLAVDTPAPTASQPQEGPFLGRPEQVAAEWKKQEEKTKALETSTTPVESMTSEEKKAEKAVRPKRQRKAKNTVALDVEPETVSASADNGVKSPSADISSKSSVSTFVETASKTETVPAPPPQIPAPESAVTQVSPSSPVPVSTGLTPVAGMPTEEQMTDFRKRISVYTQQLPPSTDLSATSKMRGFMTKYNGVPPQQMTAAQYEDTIGWMEKFVATNGIKGLIKYINDLLGVK